MNPVEFYKCLSEDTRLRCLLLLQRAGELCVCDLVTALELSQPKISRHLAQLRELSLVTTRKQGKWVYYQLHPALPEWVQTVLRETGRANADYLSRQLTRLQTANNQCCG